MIVLDENFWNNRYIDQKIGWDLGETSSPLKGYIDQIENRELTILVPGAGNGYEVEYLWRNGFENVHFLDLAVESHSLFQERNQDFPLDQMHNQDFFDHKGCYDLILEQTFFCAINPELRKEYVEKSHELLNINGEISGLLFDKKFEKEGPPFGGGKEEYLSLFSEKFKIKLMDKSYNSVAPRMGWELFFIVQKIK